MTGVTHFTFCASARLVNETGTDFYNILSSGENGPDQLQWGINDNDLRMAFYHADINPVESNVAIERFEWYHTAVVYDGTDLILYLNAEEVQRQSVTLNMTQSVRFIGQWLVESDNLGAREPWHGQLDHVGIWNTALSQNQIAQQMSCPNSPELDGLLVLWDFEADAGNVVSGNGNVVSIGTVIGANYAALVPDNLCPGCSATDSIHVTVDFNCIYCGEGTEWDEESQQCIAVDSGPTPSCGEGTVWDPVAQECIVAIPTDTDFDGCVTAGDVLNLLATFGTCPPIPEWPDTPSDTTGTSWMCGDPLPYQDYDYTTVQIGDQCWFAENLRNTAYSTGDPIETVTNIEDWVASTEGLVETYGTNVWGCQDLEFAPFDVCNPDSSLQYFGRHYNWYAVNDTRGLCPSGWHVPSDSAFATLEAFLGIPEDELFILGERGENQGSLLKSNPSDPYPWNGNNTTGFSAVPSGSIHNGLFTPTPSSSAGLSGSIWTSSAYLGGPPYAWYRGFRGNHDEISRDAFYRYMGRSVRCLKD